MAKKDVIIVVPGVKALSKWPRVARIMGYALCRALGFKPVYEDHLKIWEKKICFGKSKILFLSWSRNPDPLSKLMAVRKLRNLINSLKDSKIKLVGISIGGEIILEAIKGGHFKNVKKVILVCSINETHRISEKKAKIINLYSSRDGFAEAVIDALSFFDGSKKLAGKNVVNINLRNMDHADFCTDAEIPLGKYRGKKPSDIVNAFLND